MTKDTHDRLAVEYVLGMLEGEEKTLAESLLLTHPAFKAAVDHLHEHFLELDDTAPAIVLTDQLWQRIEKGLAPAPGRQAAPAPPSRANAFGGFWDSLTFWRITGLTAAVASLLLALGAGYFAYKASRQPTMIAVLLNNANQPGAVIRTFADGRAELVPLEGTSIPENQSMQLWTLPDSSGPPVSIGVTNAVRTLQLNLQHLPGPRPTQLFEISLEPIGGSTTGRPSGPVILKGTASAAL